MLIENLENKLKTIAQKFLGKEHILIRQKIKVMLPEKLEYGDYSSNILFLLSQVAKKTPEECFSLIKEKVEKINYVEKVEYLNGYLNIFLNKKIFFKNYKKILLDNKKFIQNNYGRRRKLILEYVSANPTGPLHIGNTRGAIIGDCLAKVLSLNNFRVTKEYYVNNCGRQIDLLKDTLLYYLGKRGYNEEYYQGDYLKEFVEKFKDKLTKLNEKALIQFAIKYILDYLIKKPLLQLGTNFDNFYFETSLYHKGLDKKILNLFAKKNLIEKREGAIWLKLTSLGEVKDEVLIKSNQEPTYFFSDILYNYEKFFLRKFKYSIILVSSDHQDHARRLLAVFEKVFKIPPNRFLILIYQMVQIVKGESLLKMSKRKGTYLSLEDALKELGVNPIRFYFIKYALENRVEIDVDLFKKESEENLIWYILYTYARLNSIIEKAKKRQFKINHKKVIKTNIVKSFSLLINKPEYLRIFRIVNRLPDLIYTIARELRPNILATNLLELCQEINQFYEKEKILSSSEAKYKLIFILHLIKVLELYFYILGIKPLKKLYSK